MNKNETLEIKVQVKEEDIDIARSKTARKVVVKTDLQKRPKTIGVWYDATGDKRDVIEFSFNSKKRLVKAAEKALQPPVRLGWTLVLYTYFKAATTDVPVKFS